MFKIYDFEKLNLAVTWKLIRLGFKNEMYFKDMLDVNDIINYSISIFLENEDILIREIACEYPDNTEEIVNKINELAQKENSEEQVELRKWIVLYVIKNLPNISDNYFYGLNELKEICGYLSFRGFLPNDLYPNESKIGVENYYVESNYINMINHYNMWIGKELEQLRNFGDPNLTGVSTN